MTTPNNDYTRQDGTIPFLNRKLHRSKTDSMLFGVLGGIAETYNMDATFLRIIVAVTTLFFQPMALVYIIAAYLMWKT
ncbi:PspC domain-containing protein [Corynebacterium sp. H130]|uniref:PspC domain-containing protein n=1 Tax=Corynebacterium sp. H130 TaxID=3133444 RepID=UPI003098B137